MARSDECGGVPCDTLRADAAPYDMENPPEPKDAGAVVQPYSMRWAPLCEDGSGDHEWTLDHGRGTPPACDEADYVRCGDGSRPLYYADVAAGGAWEDGVERWLIWAGDGGGWTPAPEAQAPLRTDNFIFLLKNVAGNTSATEPFEANGIEGMFRAVPGVPAGVPTPQEWFGTYTNRVFIDKCSSDTWLGTTHADFPALDPPYKTYRLPSSADEECGCCAADAVDCEEEEACGCADVRIDYPAGGYRMYYHGRRIISAVLADLSREDGIVTYATYDLDAAQETFPRLNRVAGEQVVFASASNGSHGHYHRIDSLADELPDVDVRGVMGQYFPPRIEAEHALSIQGAQIITDNTRSVYDQVLTGTSITGLELTLETLSADGGLGLNYAGWGAQQDTSCLAAGHATDDEHALCRDAMHVALNHITTPIWVYMGQRDRILNASATIFHSPHCRDDDGPVGCGYTHLLPLVAYRAAVRKQLADLATRHDQSEEADHSRLMVFTPDVTSHGGLVGDLAVGFEVAGQSQAKVMVGWLTDQIQRGYCMTAWPASDAQPGNTNEELTGDPAECVIEPTE